MSESTNVNSLFQSAQDDGLITGQSMSALNIPDIGAQIQAALGVNVNSVNSSEVVLVTMMPDDSGSIRFSGNAQAVRDGHNTVLDALDQSQQKQDLLLHTRYLNGDILYPYCSLENTIRMDRNNYNPNKGTPLYDQTVVLLGTVVAKTQEFSDNGVPVRSVTLIITDGADEHSVRATSKDVASLVNDLLRTEMHIIAAMGIDDGGYTDFKKIFKEMGIRDEWILTPTNTESDIRKAFQVFSQSAIQASQSAANFNQASLGGFGV